MSHRRKRNLEGKQRREGDRTPITSMTPPRRPLANGTDIMEKEGLVPVVVSMKNEMTPEVFSRHLYLAMLQDSFQCQCCGNCCREEVPVAAAEPELEPLARSLNMTVEDVKREFVEPLRMEQGVQYYAINRIGDSCIFLKDNKCVAYSGRPMVCRTFPFYTDTCRKITLDDALTLPPECPGAKEHVEKFRKAILAQDRW